MIRTEALTKHFCQNKGQTVVAVDHLDLEVAAGEVFGFLGPNGAGKTTTMRMLAALVSPTSGRAWVNGHEIGRSNTEVRRSVGILTESPGLYDRLSARKNLEIFANLAEVEDVDGRIEKYLRMLGLWDRRDHLAGNFSKGMRQKLAICRALLHEPKVLFLDEPTSGLDPEASRLVHDFIIELKAERRTIFMNTHNLDEADRLCDRIGVMKQRMVKVDSPENLRRNLFGRRVVFHLAAADLRLAPTVQELPFVQSVQPLESNGGGALVVGLSDPEAQNPIIVRKLVEAGAEVRFVGELKYSLEDVYMALVGNRQ